MEQLSRKRERYPKKELQSTSILHGSQQSERWCKKGFFSESTLRLIPRTPVKMFNVKQLNTPKTAPLGKVTGAKKI